MKQYLISFDVVSSGYSLDELSALLDAEPSASSHARGDIRFRDKVWKYTVWRRVMMDGGEDRLQFAWEELMRFIENTTAALLNLKQLEPGVVFLLNVGVIASTATTTVQLPGSVLIALGKVEGSVEITTYPAE